MLRIVSLLLLAFILLCWSCSVNPDKKDALSLLQKLPSLKAKDEFKQTPYVTAGDRVYAVGYQDGSFPDIGWHVRGEMGGIWNHPIKLMDGFQLMLTKDDGRTICLQSAAKFINYPVANYWNYQLPVPGLSMERIQFVPDSLQGMVVDLKFINQSEEDLTFTLEFRVLIDLMPVWLAERLDLEDRKDLVEWNSNQQVLVAKDSLNPWFVTVGSNRAIIANQPGNTCLQQRKGNGRDHSLYTDVVIYGNSSTNVRFYIAGSYKSKEEALATQTYLQENYINLLESKINRYEAIAALANIEVPDDKIKAMYDWLKWNTDWLIRDVPEVGRGLSAGVPDFPWWFGADNCYTLQALLATGRHDEVKNTLALLLNLSEKVNGNGRIIHEASTNGVVFNKGNLNETPHFIWLLWEYFQWTGDLAFLQDAYPTVKDGLQWISETDKDGNGYPDGPGMMEIHGLHSEMIDVIAYTQAAYQAAAHIAEVLSFASDQQAFQHQADELKAKIEGEWWVEEAGSYADFRATREEALELVKAAIVRADTLNKPWAVKELEAKLKQIESTRQTGTGSYVVHHNWVVNTPLEMKIASGEKAKRALETARQYTNTYGMYVTGIDRNEKNQPDDNSTNWQEFSYVGAVMTLPTGVQAVAEANYGNPDEALSYMHKLYNSFSYALPGSMYEVSPDYGQIVQAWNIYGVAVPLVKHFLGIQPVAHQKLLNINPILPTGWDQASIQKLSVGKALIDYKVEIKDAELHLNVTASEPGWKINFTDKSKWDTIYVNNHMINISNLESNNIDI